MYVFEYINRLAIFSKRMGSKSHCPYATYIGISLRPISMNEDSFNIYQSSRYKISKPGNNVKIVFELFILCVYYGNILQRDGLRSHCPNVHFIYS